MDNPSSTKPRKQRKYLYKMPLHRKKSHAKAALTDKLREKYKRRNLPLRKGDGVKVMRGSFKGVSGEVTRVDLKKSKVYVEGVTATKIDGTQVPRPVAASNLIITELNLEDEMRRKALERKDIEVEE